MNQASELSIAVYAINGLYVCSVENATQGAHEGYGRLEDRDHFRYHRMTLTLWKKWLLKDVQDFNWQRCWVRSFKSVDIAHMVLRRWESERHSHIVQSCQSQGWTKAKGVLLEFRRVPDWPSPSTSLAKCHYVFETISVLLYLRQLTPFCKRIAES